MSGIVRGSIRIRWPRPASLTWRIARATESGSNSTPTSSVAGNRRATAISHLPPPHATSRTRAAAAERRGELRQLGQALLEEHRDVLDGDGLDRPVEARRPLVDRPAGPEELGQAGVVEARRRPRRRTGRRGTPDGCRRGGPTTTSSSSGARSPSRSTRSPAWAARTHASTGSGRQPVAVASASAVSPAAPAARIAANRPSSSPR